LKNKVISKLIKRINPRNHLFLRIVLFLVFKERGAIRNSYGSIMSPKEIDIQRSAKLEKRILYFKELIQPVVMNKKDLRRYGSVADGGYILSKSAVKNSTFLISGGIELNNEFEVELAKLGIRGIQIDNSIDTPPVLHKNLTFVKATLGNSEEVDINRLVSEFPIKQSGILKLDIEGAEYSVLQEINSFKRYNAIVMEFHGLHRIASDDFWFLFEKILTKLQKEHQVIYISPNNCCPFTIIGGSAILNVMEITWVKKSLIIGTKFRKIDTLHPFYMAPNRPSNANLDIAHLFPRLTV
jgi:hypothetical protein